MLHWILRHKNPLFWLAVVAAMAGAIWFGLAHPNTYGAVDTNDVTYVRAQVQSVDEEKISDVIEGIRRGTQELTVKVLTGKSAGDLVPVTNWMTIEHSVYLKAGDTFILNISYSGDTKVYSVYNYERTGPIFLIFVIFGALLILMGGLKGLRSLFGLVFTFIMMIFVLLPQLTMGIPFALACFITLVPIILVLPIVLDGFSRQTGISILSIAIGMGLSVLLFALFSSIVHVNGYNVDDADTLVVISQRANIHASGLLFVGVIISSLGAIIDIAVSITSSAAQIAKANPSITRGELMKSSMHVGKDIMGATANTLILAFAGSFFTTLFLLRIYDADFNLFMNMDSLAIEICQSMAATVALIIVTPLTSFISSRFYVRSSKQKRIAPKRTAR